MEARSLNRDGHQGLWKLCRPDEHCVFRLSDLSFSPLSEHPGGAGVVLGCWKLGLEPFFSPGFPFRVWPHLGHDIYSLERFPNLGGGWAGFPPQMERRGGCGDQRP